MCIIDIVVALIKVNTLTIDFTFIKRNVMNEFNIYVYGDIESYFHVFNAIAMLVQSDWSTLLAQMALMITFIRVGLSFSKANPQSGATGIAVALAISAALLSPTATAHFIDLRTGIDKTKTASYTKVDNLPFAIVALASWVSIPTVTAIEKFDQAFSSIDTSKTSAIGIGKQYEMMLDFVANANLETQQNGSKLRYYNRAFKIYLNECVIPQGLPSEGLVYLENPNGDLIEAIDSATLGLNGKTSGITFVDDSNNTTNKCEEIYAYLSNERDTVGGLIVDKLKKKYPNIDWATQEENIAKGLAVNTGIKVTSDVLNKYGSYTAGLKVAALNFGLSGVVLPKVLDGLKFELPSATTTTAGVSVKKSLYDMQLDGKGLVSWLNKVAPLVIHFGLIFSYAMFVPMMLFAMGMGWENSTKILSNYGMGIVAIHTGYIVTTIANNLVLIYSRHEALDLINSLGNNMTAMRAIPQYLQYAGDMSGISGVLLLSAYSIGSAIIFKGESAAAAGMLQTIGSRYKNNMLNTSEDIAQKIAYDQVEKDQKTKDAQKWLNNMGFDKDMPVGVDEVEYANSLKRSINSMGSGIGFTKSQQIYGEEFLQEFMGGVSNKEITADIATATLGADISSSQASQVGEYAGKSEVAKNKASLYHMNGGEKKKKDHQWEEDLKAIENSKIDSLMGNALGILANRKKGVSYQDNANLSEQSKQQTIKAKLDVQGGDIKKTVKLDVDTSTLKTASQVGDIKSAKDLAKDKHKTLAQIGETMGAMSGAKKYGSAINFAEKLNAKNMEEIYKGIKDTKNIDGSSKFSPKQLQEIKKEMQDEKGNWKTGASAAAWVSGKQAGHLSGVHGLNIKGKTLGLAIDDKGVRITGIDDSRKDSSGYSSVTTQGKQYNVLDNSTNKAAQFLAKLALPKNATSQQIQEKAEDITRDFQMAKQVENNWLAWTAIGGKEAVKAMWQKATGKELTKAQEAMIDVLGTGGTALVAQEAYSRVLKGKRGYLSTGFGKAKDGISKISENLTDRFMFGDTSTNPLNKTDSTTNNHNNPQSDSSTKSDIKNSVHNKDSLNNLYKNFNKNGSLSQANLSAEDKKTAQFLKDINGGKMPQNKKEALEAIEKFAHSKAQYHKNNAKHLADEIRSDNNTKNKLEDLHSQQIQKKAEIEAKFGKNSQEAIKIRAEIETTQKDIENISKKIESNTKRLNTANTQADLFEAQAQHTQNELDKHRKHSKGMSKTAKGFGMFATALAALDIFASNDGDIGKVIDFLAEEGKGSWNQFRDDVKRYGGGAFGNIQAGANQVMDFLVGEENRKAIAKQDGVLSASAVLTASAVDTATGMASSFLAPLVGAGSFVGGGTYNQGAQPVKEFFDTHFGASLANIIANSNMSSPTANALMTSTQVDNGNIAMGTNQVLTALQDSNTTNEQKISNDRVNTQVEHDYLEEIVSVIKSLGNLFSK